MILNLPVPRQYCDVEVIAADLDAHYKTCRMAREARASLKKKTRKVTKVRVNGPTPPSETIQEKMASSNSSGRVSCAVCGRLFSRDRIGTHQRICRSNARPNRRGVFDSTKQRLEGTDMMDMQASYPRRGGRGKRGKVVPPRLGRSNYDRTVGGSSKWKQKSQQLRETMRLAKLYNKVEKRGGDVSSLPPPLVMPEPTNFIQCPFCGRTFNPQSGERHIKACEHTVHKPNMLRRKSGLSNKQAGGPYRPTLGTTSFGAGRSPMHARIPARAKGGHFNGRGGMENASVKGGGAGGIGLTNASSLNNPLVSSPHQSAARRWA